MDGGGKYDRARPERGGGGDQGAAAAAGRLLSFRSRTLRVAAFFILWGASGIVAGAVHGLSVGLDHLLLCFCLLMVGIALLILTVAAPGCRVAARAAAALESWLMSML